MTGINNRVASQNKDRNFSGIKDIDEDRPWPRLRLHRYHCCLARGSVPPQLTRPRCVFIKPPLKPYTDRGSVAGRVRQPTGEPDARPEVTIERGMRNGGG
jgi:hypothetical protein